MAASAAERLPPDEEETRASRNIDDDDNNVTSKDEESSSSSPFLHEARALLRIALPTLVIQLGFVVPPFLAASYVGRYLGHVYLAGYQLAFLTVNLFTLSLLTGLFSAADTLAPQAYGTANYAQVGVVALRCLVGSLALMLPAAAVLVVTLADLLVAMGEDPVAAAHAATWYRAFVVALPFYALYMALWKFLSAQSNVRVSMRPLVVASVVNLVVLLPAAMHFFVRWYGFIGSAWAYALYQISQALLVLAMVCVTRPYRAACWPGMRAAWSQVFYWKPLAQFLHLGLGGIAASSEWIYWETISLGVGTLGVVSLSAHAVASQFLSIAFLGSFGVGVSLSIRLGHTLPVDVPRARALVEVTTLISCVVFALASWTLYLFRTSVYRIFTHNPDVQEECDQIWSKVCVYFFLVSWFALNTGIANGLGMQWRLGKVTILFLWCLGVPALFYYGVSVYQSLDVVWDWISPPYAFINASLVYTFVTSDWNEISLDIRKREGAAHTPETECVDDDSDRTTLLSNKSVDYGSVEENKRTTPTKESPRHGRSGGVRPHLAICCWMLLGCFLPYSAGEMPSSSSIEVDNLFLLGTGIYDITGPAAQVNMMGYAKPEQTTAGIHQRLRARAFVFSKQLNDLAIPLLRNQHSNSWWTWRSRLRASPVYELDPLQTICFVSIDAGMGSDLLNIRVLDRLDELLPGKSPCTIDNLSISGTHTHSAPGGFIQYVLYQLTGTGFVEETMSAFVEGTAQAIFRACQKIQPGHLKLSQGMLWDANINRSPTSYLLNPQEERDAFREHGDTDKTMIQILLQDEQATPLGLLNWFAVHGTSMNGTNQLISGDNKGYASYLMEKHYNGNTTLPGKGAFVAAFASTNLGDVSPNTAGPKCLDSGLPCDMLTSTCNGHMPLCVAFGPGRDMFESTEIIGRKQYKKSLELLQGSSGLVHGGIRSRHAFVDMSHRNVTLSNGTIVQTCPAALGLSFAGGTMDGSGGLDFHQGMNTSHRFWDMVFGHLSLPSKEQIACQAPKPIMLNTGKVKVPYDWDPNTIPISIFQVGNLFILNVPGELTTMAGRRLRQAVAEELDRAGLLSTDVVITIAGLANSYTHYVTTWEEYQAQRYEAASTLYGPFTLDAYLQEFRRLTRDLVQDLPSVSDEAPRDLSRRQVSLLAPVELDLVAPRHKFGEVVNDALDSYVSDGNGTVRVVFRSANPRNNQRLEGTFLTVDHLTDRHGTWETLFVDGDWSTRYYWKGGTASTFGMSFAEIEWHIPAETPQGLYRICHYGSRLTLWGDVKYLAYYLPEWMDPLGSSIGAFVLNQSLRFAVAMSETLRSFFGMQGSYRLQDFSGCSKTFLVHAP